MLKIETIDKGYLGFAEGMLIGMERRSYNGGAREVDWNMVKEFIEANKHLLDSVVVGLAEDWGYTSGEVWNSKEGYIAQEDTYVFGSSSWATPSMEVKYFNRSTSKSLLEVWKYGNNADSYFEFDEKVEGE